MSGPEIFMGLVADVVVMFFAFRVGYLCNDCDQKLKVEAVKRGFAKWVADEDGDATFVWEETK